MIRIGVVNLDVSHPVVFSEYLKNDGRAKYVAVYNDGFRDDDQVDAFIERYAIEKRCRSIAELADMVDIGFVQSCNWDDHLKQALPFIEKGKPVFIDKPIVGSLVDCKALEKLAARGAVILGSSSVRYSEEIVGFAAKSEEETGKILNIFGTSGMDEFNYSIHIVEGIGGILGTGAISNQFVGRCEMDGKACETYYVRYGSGVTATYNTCLGTWQPFEMVIQTTKSTYQFRIDTGKLYAPLLDGICGCMETGKQCLAPVSDITESVKIMLAGRISRANGGIEVKLSGIPEDDPGFDGDQFERGYSAVAVSLRRMFADLPG